MTDEDITVRTGDVTCLRTAELEHVIERLVVIAEDQGRGFLAYLLAMALEHLPRGGPRKPKGSALSGGLRGATAS